MWRIIKECIGYSHQIHVIFQTIRFCTQNSLKHITFCGYVKLHDTTSSTCLYNYHLMHTTIIVSFHPYLSRAINNTHRQQQSTIKLFAIAIAIIECYYNIAGLYTTYYMYVHCTHTHANSFTIARTHFVMAANTSHKWTKWERQHIN